MAGETAFTRGKTSVSKLDSAWRERLIDAEILLKAERWPSALAMGLYAVEILLKVKICKHLDLDMLPEAFQFHDLVSLLRCSGLSRRITSPDADRVNANWELIQALSKELNNLRYGDHSTIDRTRAIELFASINDPNHGVLSWISTQM